MFEFIKKQSPVRVIALGFALVILLGSVLLIMPFSVQEGVDVAYIDTLYTSTSAVCVTGLISTDAGDTFTFVGQLILAALIQVGGLGVTSVGAGIILAMGRKINLKERSVLQEALNLDSAQGPAPARAVDQHLPLGGSLQQLGLRHPGQLPEPDPLPGQRPPKPHHLRAHHLWRHRLPGHPGRAEPPLPLEEVLDAHQGGHQRQRRADRGGRGAAQADRGHHLAAWLGAFFHSVSARTAGFSTYPLGEFNSAGLLVLIVLMFIGASPGSTGGGIKTSTFFVLLQGIKSAATNRGEKAFRYSILQGIKSAATNRGEKAFRYSIPSGAFRKAAVITLIAVSVVLTGTWLLLIFDPQLEMVDALFEMTSAFGTVGLSTGITTALSVPSKLVSILIMYIGRLGPLTIASVWYFNKGERIRYPEGNIAIG